MIPLNEENKSTGEENYGQKLLTEQQVVQYYIKQWCYL
jgi:hypothetical protein